MHKSKCYCDTVILRCGFMPLRNYEYLVVKLRIKGYKIGHHTH